MQGVIDGATAPQVGSLSNLSSQSRNQAREMLSLSRERRNLPPGPWRHHVMAAPWVGRHPDSLHAFYASAARGAPNVAERDHQTRPREPDSAEVDLAIYRRFRDIVEGRLPHADGIGTTVGHDCQQQARLANGRDCDFGRRCSTTTEQPGPGAPAVAPTVLGDH